MFGFLANDNLQGFLGCGIPPAVTMIEILGWGNKASTLKLTKLNFVDEGV